MLARVVRVALRDLRHGYRGFWIFFSCLALGVAAITLVTILSSGLISGIQRDGQLILGGDLAVQQQFRELTDEPLAALNEYAVEMAQFVELTTLLRTTDTQNSILVSLKAVNDTYPLYGTVKIQDGSTLADAIAWDGAAWGALVDPFIVTSGRAQVGDQVGFGTNSFRVTGIIDDEPDRMASAGRFAFWPRVIVHRDALDNSGLLGFGSRSSFEYRAKLVAENDPGEVVAELQSQFPGLNVRDFHNASPNLSEIVDRIGVLLSLAGLTTLLIGGVGVSNAVRAYLETRLTTIAILKCIGGSHGFVLRTFLFQMLLLSAVGVLIGLLIGIVIALFTSVAVERLLSVPLDVTLRPALMVIIVTYGMLTAMLFTLWPLTRALNTSPAILFRNFIAAQRPRMGWQVVVATAVIALLLASIVIYNAQQKSFAIWFVIGVTVAFLVFRLISIAMMKLAKLAGGRFSSVIRLALANLHRPGAATADTVLAIGLGLSVLIATAMVSTNLNRQISDLIPERAPAFFFIGVQSTQMAQFRSLLAQSGGVTQLNTRPFIPGRITRIKGLDPYDALVDEAGEWLIDDGGERIFSYTAEPLDNVSMVAGEWWPADYQGAPLLSIHKDVADSFALTIGDEITLNILGREIIGRVHNVRDLEWRSMQLNFAIMLSPAPLQSVPHSNVATAHVDADAEFAVQDLIAGQMPNVTVIRVKEALSRVSALVSRGRTAAQSISVVTIIAGILVLAGIVISENRRRAYESVLLKTIGASRRFILTTFSLEYFIQGVVAALAAILVGSLISWAVIKRLMGWDWYFMPWSAINTIIFGLTIALSLGMLGIWRALRHRPLYYLRNE